MSEIRPYALSIAGYDPSGGAGLLADIKTMEANHVYGLGVCSALTFQNDIEFERVKWISYEQIVEQIDILYRRLRFKYVKIGLIESLDVLKKLTNHLLQIDSEMKIIWDPILKASAGFTFHNQIEAEKLFSVLQKLFLVTPNLDEAKVLFANIELTNDNLSAIIQNKDLCSVLLKGGHSEGDNINDILFENGQQTVFKGKRFNGYSKHGTGCVLSSAISSNLAKGEQLDFSCEKAKEYIHQLILSNKTNLGYHF